MSDNELFSRLRERLAAVGTHGASRGPCAENVIETAESELGFRLDPLLRRIYLEVSDGGFGPGPHGALPLTGSETVPVKYAEFRAAEEPSMSWPEGLAPVWDWGDAAWSCVDDVGRIVTHDDVDGPTLTGFTVTSWLAAWLDDVDLWNEIYNDKTATILDPFTKKPISTLVRGTVKGRRWPGRN